MSKYGKTYWHEAHFQALQMELHEYADILEFHEEHPLSKEALRIDVVIIKKNKDVQIDKNIGRIFRKFNIVEFKSEEDSFSVWDYNKILGYAYLYSSFEQIPMSDITLTVSLTMYPRELVKYLVNECGLTIADTGEGIYYIEGGAVPIQILESKKLSKSANIFLRSLRSNLSTEDIMDTLTLYKEQRPLNEKDVYLDRIVMANYKIFEEVVDMTAEFKELILESAERNGWLEERMEKNAIENAKSIAKRLLLHGHSVEDTSEFTKLPIETVLSLQ